MEQLVARWAHNPKVAGSSPVPATKNLKSLNETFFLKKIMEELLDKLHLIRIIGTVNGEETLFLSILKLNDNNNENIFINSMKNKFSNGVPNFQLENHGDLGGLSEHLFYKFNLDEEGKRIFEFIKSKQVSELLINQGCLIVRDETFEEFQYSFYEEEDKCLGIDSTGEFISIGLSSF